MNCQAALQGLPLPNDCVDIINSYLYIDSMSYELKLVKKTIRALLKTAVTPYNLFLHGRTTYGTWVFRWYPYHKYQFQTPFCCKCGEYLDVRFGALPDCCSCKCF